MPAAAPGHGTAKGSYKLAYYETVLIARQDVSSSAVDALVDRFTAVLEEGEGKVKKCENWGLRNLAYRIKKNRKGHYVLLNIDAPAPAVHEMERQMRLDEDVLRYLTVRVDELEDGPSPMLRAKERREERDRGDRDRGDRDRDRGDRDRDRGDRGGRRDRGERSDRQGES